MGSHSRITTETELRASRAERRMEAYARLYEPLDTYISPRFPHAWERDNNNKERRRRDEMRKDKRDASLISPIYSVVCSLVPCTCPCHAVLRKHSYRRIESTR
jgi:hypothetical protein